jgi:hypothetical protein
MNGAALIRWGTSRSGREAKGLEVFGSAIAYFENMSKQGRIHGHREYFSVTGRDSGFMMLEGEVDELTRILGEPDTLKLNAQASAIVEDFEIQVYAGGTDQAVAELTGNYTSSLQQLGYM